MESSKVHMQSPFSNSMATKPQKLTDKELKKIRDQKVREARDEKIQTLVGSYLDTGKFD